MATPSLRADEDLPAAVVSSENPIQVDGNSQDWEGVKAIHTVKTPAGTEVGVFRMVNTDDTLYLLFEVTDDSPLKNSSSVLQELFKGGDAVGILLGRGDAESPLQRIFAARVNGDDTLIALRPKWPEKMPHTYSSPVGERTMDYVGPITGSEVAFAESDDGYIAELALPLTALNLDPDSDNPVPFDAQIVFSDPAGNINTGTAFWHATGGPGFTTEDLPTEAGLYPETWGTVRFFSKDPGPRIQEIETVAKIGIPIEFELPRDAKVSLIVTDSEGWIVRELVRAEKYPKGSHSVYWNGRDRYDEPLPPGEYRWKLAYFDGMGTQFHGSVGNSARPPFRTPDGMGSMGGQHGGSRLLASDESGIYIVSGAEEGHPAMRKIDREGYTLWKRSMGGFGIGRGITTDDEFAYLIQKRHRGDLFLVRLDPLNGREVDFADGKDRIILNDNDEPVGGMAVVDNRIYFSRPTLNRIEVVQLPGGTFLDSINVQAPGDLAPSRDGKLLVVTDDAVHAYDPKTGQSKKWIGDLEGPRAIATDPDGRIYLSDRSDDQRIKVFEDRRLTDYIGEPGGRPDTVLDYDPDAINSAKSLTIDKEGSLWAIEQSRLSRVARFSMDGTCELELFGPVAYNVFGPNLDDPSTVYYQPNAKHGTTYVETHVDYEAYREDPERGGTDAWKIEAIFDLGQNPGETGVDLFSESMAMGYGHVVAFTADNGQRYLWRMAKSNRATFPKGAAIFRWDNDWIPAAFVSNSEDLESWSDRNGDGKVQAYERYPHPETRSFAWLDRNLTLYGFDGTLSPTAVDERGVPDYENAVLDPYVSEGPGPKELTLPGGGWTFNSMPDDEGAVYYAINSGTHRHRTFWDRASENAIIKVQDGRAQWAIGKNNPYMETDSDMSTLSGIAGIVDDILIAHIVEPARYIAFTTDGLTLGNVIVDETGKQPSVGPNAIYIESFTGLFIRDPRTGKRLLFSVSSGDDRILEVTGPGNLTRMEGTLKIESSFPRNHEPVGATRIPYETWFGSISRGYDINATRQQWTDEPNGLFIRDEEGVIIGDVRLRRDAGALHLLADTLSPVPGGQLTQPADYDQPWGELQGVELMLGPASGSAGRPAMEGDVRLFFAVDGNGEEIALVHRFGSDSWEPLEGAKVGWQKRVNDYGWRLEAEIPLESFPEIASMRLQKFKRGNPVKEQEANLPDITQPIRLNAALHFQEDDTIVRAPWMNDFLSMDEPFTMTPAQWGYANALVTLRWPSNPKTNEFAIYRTSKDSPGDVTLVAASVRGTTYVDTPGLGQYLYWIAPVVDGVIGQPAGPSENLLSDASFSQVPVIDSPAFADTARLTVSLPNRIALINITSDAETLKAESFPSVSLQTERFSPGIWTILIGIPYTANIGDQIPLQLTATDASGSETQSKILLSLGIDLMAGLRPGSFENESSPQAGWSREPKFNASDNPKHIVEVVESDEVFGPVVEMAAWNSDNVIRHPLQLSSEEIEAWRVQGEIRILRRFGGTTSGVRVLDAAGNEIADLKFKLARIDGEHFSVLTGQDQYLIQDPEEYEKIADNEWQPFQLSATEGVIEISFGSGPDEKRIVGEPGKDSNWQNPAFLEVYQEGRTSGRNLRVGGLYFEAH